MEIAAIVIIFILFATLNVALTASLSGQIKRFELRNGETTKEMVVFMRYLAEILALDVDRGNAK